MSINYEKDIHATMWSEKLQNFATKVRYHLGEPLHCHIELGNASAYTFMFMANHYKGHPVLIVGMDGYHGVTVIRSVQDIHALCNKDNELRLGLNDACAVGSLILYIYTQVYQVCPPFHVGDDISPMKEHMVVLNTPLEDREIRTGLIQVGNGLMDNNGEPSYVCLYKDKCNGIYIAINGFNFCHWPILHDGEYLSFSRHYIMEKLGIGEEVEEETKDQLFEMLRRLLCETLR